MNELAELTEQRASIQESLLEAIFEGTNEEVEFFRFLLVDIEEGIRAFKQHLHSGNR
jgi:hypothetical protein